MPRTVQLNDGTSMPAIGWGNMGSSEKALEGGAEALRAGILHIDSAQIYRTEKEVPGAIEKAGLERKDVYVTTKLFNMPDGPKLHSLPEVKASVSRSLAALGSIPNLLLIHNPFIPVEGHLGEFWTWLEDMVYDGTLKGCSLGVSNFRPVDLEQVLKVARIKPVVNQIELHPYVLTHVQPLLDLHTKEKIVTQAFASLAPTTRHPTGGPLKPVLERIALSLSKESTVEVDASGVLLLWIMAKGGVCITSSSSPERIRRMADLEKVRDLTADEVREIDEVGSKVYFRQWASVLLSLDAGENGWADSSQDEHMTTDFPTPDLPSDL